jgi:hypothetical protein
MTEGIWAASGIRLPELSKLDRERLAVLRVTVVAADPAAEKVLARRADLLALLTVVDRLAQGPAVESVMVVDKATVGAFFAGTMRIHQNVWRLALRRRKGVPQ